MRLPEKEGWIAWRTKSIIQLLFCFITVLHISFSILGKPLHLLFVIFLTAHERHSLSLQVGSSVSLLLDCFLSGQCSVLNTKKIKIKIPLNTSCHWSPQKKFLRGCWMFWHWITSFIVVLKKFKVLLLSESSSDTFCLREP